MILVKKICNVYICMYYVCTYVCTHVCLICIYTNIHTYIHTYRAILLSTLEKMLCRFLARCKANNPTTGCILFLSFCRSRISICIKQTFHWGLLHLEFFANSYFCKLLTHILFGFVQLFLLGSLINLLNYLPLVIWIYSAGYKSVMLTKNAMCVRYFFTFMNYGIVRLYLCIVNCVHVPCTYTHTVKHTSWLLNKLQFRVL